MILEQITKSPSKRTNSLGRLKVGRWPHTFPTSNTPITLYLDLYAHGVNRLTEVLNNTHDKSINSRLRWPVKFLDAFASSHESDNPALMEVFFTTINSSYPCSSEIIMRFVGRRGFSISVILSIIRIRTLLPRRVSRICCILQFIATL